MLPALRVGGVYPARVARIEGDGRVRIVLEGTPLVARAERQLRRGEEVLVEVERIVPTLVLRVVRTVGEPTPREEEPAGTPS